MSQEKLYNVLLSPIVSEKSSLNASFNQYTFKVEKTANKQDIKRAVELMFGVSVTSVRTLNVSGKKKTFARKAGVRASWKKALVKLADGQMIDTTA